MTEADLPPGGATAAPTSDGAPFDAAWFTAGVQPRRAALWRGVEAQHVVSTMRLVDSAADQQVLEQLIEGSKPPLPASAEGRHYLLATPFRYRPPHESRFRRAATPGLWYGAETLRTACAEVGYWRWRFLRDSQAFDGDAALHTQHTFYKAQVAGNAIDLTKPPWNASAALWRHPSRYDTCQRLAAAAAEYAVAWIRYASAREPRGFCGAVLTPAALALKPGFAQQTWACKTTHDSVWLCHDDNAFSFDAADWA